MLEYDDEEDYILRLCLEVLDNYSPGDFTHLSTFNDRIFFKFKGEIADTNFNIKTCEFYNDILSKQPHYILVLNKELKKIIRNLKLDIL